MSKLEVDKIDPQSGTALEIGSSGDTITIPTGVTLDASNATTTLPANVVTTDGTQTLTNKSIAATQLTGTITPSDGTVTNAKIVDSTIELAKLSATGTKDATTFLRGDNTFASAGGTNTPAFLATLSASQSVSTNTETKIQFNTELFDTANAYDNSTNYRFTIPSGKSGKYFIYCGYETGVSAANTDYNDIRLFKNGTSTYYSSMNSESLSNAAFNRFPHKINIVDDCNVGDYFEVYARIGGSQATSPNIQGGSNRTFFGAYKIIE